jgi:hypothetical protein
MQACADIERGRVCSAWWSHDACDPHYINGCNACDGVMRKLPDGGPGGVDPTRSASGDVEGCRVASVTCSEVTARDIVVKILRRDRYQDL